MTRRLYNEDGYMQSFQGKVISCEAYKETTYQVVLDRTAFFPEGGGQSSDIGYLNGISVIDVQEEKGTKSEEQGYQEPNIIHILTAPLEVGSDVKGEINWEQRFDKMQQHTAEHIVSGIVNQTYGFHNVGFHLNQEIVTMDFDGVITRAEADVLEERINEVVFANVPVLITYPKKDELLHIPYRSKIDIEGQVRLVYVGEIDICACCAPHVNRTGEIGIVKLTDIQSHRGGVRITMKCGKRALWDYQEKCLSVKTLSGLLSAKEEEVVQGVERLKEDVQRTRAKNCHLQNVLVGCKVEHIQQEGFDSWIVICEDELDIEHTRELVNQLVKLGQRRSLDNLECVNVAAVFIQLSEKEYHYIIGSSFVDVRIISKRLNEECQGRGGGKSVMVQGSVKADYAQILGVLEQIRAEGL